MKFIGVCLRAIDWLSLATGKVVSYLMLMLALVVAYEVVARYAFNSPTVWVYELSAMIFGTFVILGGAYCGKKGIHANMDVLYNTMPVRARALIDILTFTLSASFAAVLFWKGGQTALRSLKILEHASTQWGPPIYPIKLMLPIGALLLLLQLSAKLIRDIAILVNGKEPESWK